MKKNVWGKFALLLAAGAILFGSLGCSSDDDDDDDVAVESVALDTTTKSVVAGETFDLTATVLPDNATGKTVTWSSSDENVAKVESGKVTAVAAGSATITAKAGDKSAACEVTVTAPVVFKSQSAEVDLSEKVSSIASATSSDTNVATVTVDGTKLTVTSVASGTATITVIAATSENNVSGTVSVTVAEDGTVTSEASEFTKIESKAAESISVDPTTASVVAESSVTLKATVTPADTTDSVTWSSDNTDVATVDNNGKVTAVAAGTATITAKAGDKTAACEVTVTAKPAEVAVTGVTLDKETAELEIDGTVELTATVSPDDATDKTVTWSSDNTDVVTVDDNGKVTAVAAGSATITAKAGDKTASCAITVKAAAGTQSYTLDLTKVKAAGKVASDDSTSPKKLDDTVTIYASASKKSIQGFDTFVKMTGGSVNIKSSNEYGLQLTLTGSATVKITALSKQEKDAAQWTMKAVSDGLTDIISTGVPAVATKEGKSTVSDIGTPAELIFTGASAGTYMLGASSDGGYLFSLVIEYN